MTENKISGQNRFSSVKSVDELKIISMMLRKKHMTFHSHDVKKIIDFLKHKPLKLKQSFESANMHREHFVWNSNSYRITKPFNFIKFTIELFFLPNEAKRF